jgi:hypothetical protein
MADEAEDPDPTIPLTEFCTELSRKVRSPELIEVFRFREAKAGRHHDTADAYRARFDNIAASPAVDD